MKKSDFSEKEFEILCCSEMLINYQCDFYFPTQRKETNKGYDARFKDKRFKALFFQFKIPCEYSKNILNNSATMFGFRTHKTTQGQQKQHNLLAKLNQKNPNSAFYFVPLFSNRNNLVKYFRSKNLFNFCLGLSPYHTLNNGDHKIYYNEYKAVQKCDSEELLCIANAKNLDLNETNIIEYNEFVEYLKIDNKSLFNFLGRYNIFMFYKLID